MHVISYGTSISLNVMYADVKPIVVSSLATVELLACQPPASLPAAALTETAAAMLAVTVKKPLWPLRRFLLSA